MNGFDLSTVTNIYLGSTPVKEVYMGTKLIWPTGTFDYATEYFTIESLEDGNQIGITRPYSPSISISTDKRTWTTVTTDAAPPIYFITLNVGEKVYIRGNNENYFIDNAYGYFTSTGKFNVSGNIMSLIYADDFKNKTTLLSSYTFSHLFCDADKLISAEHLVLPATTLTDYCYSSMFEDCTSLTTAPELPATTLARNCYSGMFAGCSSLTTAPELPAIYLGEYCYSLMFKGCLSLTKSPELPATDLQWSCYKGMFQNCTSLTKAPELPSTILRNSCYENMFAGCSSLNYIKMLATDVSARFCLDWWVHGVAPSGTFIKDASATLPTGDSGIPDGWTITNFIDYSSEYFTIESLEDGNQIGIVDSNRPSISISTDKQTWTTVTPHAAPTYFITLNTGEKAYIKGSNNAYYDGSWSTKGYFTSTGKFNVSGNIMSLIYADDFKNKTTLSWSQTFYCLFYNADKLISAEHLVLPANTLTDNCYDSMFEGCTSLTTAPELPATTLVGYCYANMFEGCTSLTTAPELPATTLAIRCYTHMFNGCTSLNYIKMLATDVSASNCLYRWVYNVASSGTFVKDASATLPTGSHGIPNGWTVETV